MGNYLDYLAWRGDLDFSTSPFNEVDNLILSELAYIKMEKIVPELDSGDTVTIRQICTEYERLGYKAEGSANDAYPLLRAAAASARYAGLRAGAYVNHVDQEKDTQFSAVCFFLPDGSSYVAYRGTDNTIVGWKEDFSLAYLSETPGQYEAVQYLDRIAARTEGPLRVGGHSKGGNLAIYAAAFCSRETGARILHVFSNDGPGFIRSVTESPEYKAVLDKVCLIIPESSMIGTLLFNKDEKKVIKSSASGVMQHDPYTWEVMGTSFVEAECQSRTSLFLDETMDRWTEKMDESQRASFVKAIFDSMEAAGADTFTELNAKRWESLTAILKAALALDPGLQKEVLQAALKLISSGKEVIWEDTELSLKESIAQLMDKLNAKVK